MFKAILITRDDDRKTQASLSELDEKDLPEGDVTLDVEFSTLNYKDGLVLNGLGGLVRHYPHVPGVDMAGTVAESSHADFAKGDRVVLTGWRVGELHWGGLAQKARVNGDWLVHRPDGLTSEQAMAIGTAGLTAMLGLMKLEAAGLTPEDGPVLVTGAAGGVGSVACTLLAQAGYTVEGSTGRAEQADYLKRLGVSKVIARDELDSPNGKPLNKEYWSACIDSVGGSTLANVLTQIKSNGAVAAIGLAGGNELNTTVIPFLLRGISLLGIDSVMCPVETRKIAWKRLADELPMQQLESMSQRVSLDQAIALGSDILKGQVRGRLVVDVNASSSN